MLLRKQYHLHAYYHTCTRVRARWSQYTSKYHYSYYHFCTERRLCLYQAEEETVQRCFRFLRFWLSSISLHTRVPAGEHGGAPIILVGTHKVCVAPSPVCVGCTAVRSTRPVLRCALGVAWCALVLQCVCREGCRVV